MNASNALENMAAQKNLHEEAANPKSLHNLTLIAEKPEGRQLDGEKIDLVNSPDSTGIILSVSFAITAGVLIILRLLAKKDQRFASNLDSHLNQVPCMNCHFFCLDPHLKCAVNPVTVLTEEAIGCLDYRPRTGNCFH